LLIAVPAEVNAWLVADKKPLGKMYIPFGASFIVPAWADAAIRQNRRSLSLIRSQYFICDIMTDSANSVQLIQAGSKFGHIEGPGSSFEGLGVCFQTFSEANKQVSASESFRFGPTPRLSAHKYRAYAKLTVRCDTLWRAFSYAKALGEAHSDGI
jgi:hypothetical protein